MVWTLICLLCGLASVAIFFTYDTVRLTCYYLYSILGSSLPYAPFILSPQLTWIDYLFFGVWNSTMTLREIQRSSTTYLILITLFPFFHSFHIIPTHFSEVTMSLVPGLSFLNLFCTEGCVFSYTLLSYRKDSIQHTFFYTWLLFRLAIIYPGDYS